MSAEGSEIERSTESGLEDDAAETERDGGDGSDTSESEARPGPFVESDTHETLMTFDHGGFPLYVKAAWAIFFVSITYYLYVYAVPDLAAWGAP